MSEKAGFLSRWARRKQAVLRGEAPVEDAAPLVAPLPIGEIPVEAPASLPVPVEPAAPDADATPVKPFDVASLPPVNLLDAASDFTAFLRPGVPAALRSAALRKAWTADPLIRDYLSPLDYGWDFNTPGGLPFGFADTLGEGADKVLQLIRQAVGEPEPPPEAGTPPAQDVPPAVPLEELPPTASLLVEADLPTALDADPEPAEPPRRRHGGALPT